MSKAERERKEAERNARRARRLAQRAEQRASRKEEQARRAAERADRLAERANRRPSRDRHIDQSIEDIVDEVAERWSRKAEDWLEEQTDRVRETGDRVEEELTDAERKARAARREAKRLEDEAEHLEEELASETRESRRNRRKQRRRAAYGRYMDTENPRWWGHGWGDRVRSHRRRHKRRGNLYRDSRRGKICGVCAGVADYFGFETWQVRLAAVMGLIFIPQVMLPAYFVTYFLMDDKPYYRRVTDRFDDLAGSAVEEERDTERSKSTVRNRDRKEKPQFDNVQAMRTAKSKFSDIEERLRAMETHVTSSRFELQRELNKISGDEAS